MAPVGNPGEGRVERVPVKPRVVFLAGSYDSKDALKLVRDKINAIPKFRVQASWLDGDIGSEEEIAVKNLNEVGDADVFILDTFLPSTTGGYHVELGAAFCTGAVTYRVGPVRNIYHRLTMHEVQDWESLYTRLKRW